MSRDITPRPTAPDDLAALLPDWSIHLRARNVAPSTIASYLRVGENLRAYLVDIGMPTAVSALTRDHLESFLAGEDCAHPRCDADGPLSASSPTSISSRTDLRGACRSEQ